jgi:hypothetical protein
MKAKSIPKAVEKILAERFLSEKQVAERWNVCTETVKRRRKGGLLTPHYFGDKAIRYRLSEVVAVEETVA